MTLAGPDPLETPLSSRPSADEETARRNAFELLRSSPIPDTELLENLCLYVSRQTLSRVLFMHDLYRRILGVHGVVMEFGCRWGQNLALFETFRGMYEPYNHTRRVVGFDSFEGFPSVAEQDGDAPVVLAGGHAVPRGYEQHLEAVLDYHERESPISHIRKFELVKGDVTETLERYLADHPETIVALAYFDLDLYEPTKRCLELIRPRLPKGAALGFDQLSYPDWPGETLAVMDTLGLGTYRIARSPTHSSPSWIVVE